MSTLNPLRSTWSQTIKLKVSTIVGKSLREVTDPLLCCCWSRPVAPIWDQGGGILVMGVTCRVMGFRTGVWNFVGAGLGFDLGLLDWSFLLGILGCFGQSLFGMFSSRGWLLFLFLAVIPFVSVSSFWECRASGGVLRYLWVGESRHATIQTCVHKPYCTRVPSCTYSYHSLCHSFDIRVLSSRGSFISPTNITVDCFLAHPKCIQHQ